jgi:hypothetical protein
MKIVTTPDATFVHRLGTITAGLGHSAWYASVTCRCGCWTRRVGPYCTELLARRVARGYQRRHRRLAEYGVLTVNDGYPGAPDIVATPDDERTFMHEAAQAVHVPPLLGHLLPGDEDHDVVRVLPTSRQETELHEATLADLERLGERMPA